MAQFRSMVITAAGQALIAKMMAGNATIKFSKFGLSETEYTDEQLGALTSVAKINQTTNISKVTKTSSSAVLVEGAFSNDTLTTGYYVNTLVLYAEDPDDGEIPYAACGAEIRGWMAPFNGLSTGGAYVKMVITVQNADKVNLIVDPAGYATIGDINDLQGQIDELQAYMGYTDDNIYGVEVDFKNNKFTRLAGAKNLTPGTDFDNIEPWHRRRCNLADDGTVNAYLGDAGYKEDGSNGQVMVEQPKFWYKVVPLETEKVPAKTVEANSQSYSFSEYTVARKLRYYVSPQPKAGFKLHPAFIKNGEELDKIYVSAFEGSLYDTSAGAYIKDDAQVADFAADKLSSIAGAKPLSGLTQNATRANIRALAEKRGANWEQSLVQAVCATELLALIEYATFDLQTAIGAGATALTDDSKSSMTVNTGATSALGNKSGTAETSYNGTVVQVVSYRGEENLWGNIWTWFDGLNRTLNSIYIADHDFKDDTNASPYTFALHCSPEGGYVSAFSYEEAFDWLFVAGEALGDSSKPVGDYFWIYLPNVWAVAALGGHWDGGLYAGPFCWDVCNASSDRDRNFGGRLVFRPVAKSAAA